MNFYEFVDKYIWLVTILGELNFIFLIGAITTWRKNER